MITVTSVLTSDNTDVLAGTQLDQVPSPGIFQVLAASTQNDTEITITLGKDTIIATRRLPQRSNGVPNDSDDRAFIIASPGGVRPVININIVTAATVYVITDFIPAG